MVGQCNDEHVHHASLACYMPTFANEGSSQCEAAVDGNVISFVSIQSSAQILDKQNSVDLM